MNTYAKGGHNERRAKKVLELDGWRVCKVKAVKFGETDFFNLFDLIAMKPNNKVKLVQVKSNRVVGLKRFGEDCKSFVPLNHASVEYWVWYDRKGWKVYLLKDKFDVLKDERK